MVTEKVPHKNHKMVLNSVIPFIFVLGKEVSFSVTLEIKRLVRFRYVPVAFHELTQLTENATGYEVFISKSFQLKLFLIILEVCSRHKG